MAELSNTATRLLTLQDDVAWVKGLFPSVGVLTNKMFVRRA